MTLVHTSHQHSDGCNAVRGRGIGTVGVGGQECGIVEQILSSRAPKPPKIGREVERSHKGAPRLSGRAKRGRPARSPAAARHSRGRHFATIPRPDGFPTSREALPAVVAWRQRQQSAADQEGSESGRTVEPAAALPVSSTRRSLEGDTRRRLRHPTSSRPRSGGNQLV